MELPAGLHGLGMTRDPILIAHVIHHLVIGGMENGLVNLVNHLPPRRFRHLVLCVEDFSDFRNRIQRDDVEVVALHRSKTGTHAMRQTLFRLFRQHRPVIVHSRNQSGLDALLPAWLAQVPVRVHGEHGWDVDNVDGTQRKAAILRRLHSPLVNRYVTVSRDLARFLTERIGISPSRITTICNGVDTAQFHPGPPAHDLPLPHGFLGADTVCIGAVGRLRPIKDQATLLAAFAEALRQRPDLRSSSRLLIVGDGPLRDALESSSRALGIDGLTHFTGASGQVAAWLKAMDVFVLPSLNEGISNTLLEAMSSGLPVLASAVGGNVELVTPGAGGDLFAPGDVPALAKKLLNYLDCRSRAHEDGATARLQAERRFSLESMVNQYGALYDTLAGSAA